MPIPITSGGDDRFRSQRPIAQTLPHRFSIGSIPARHGGGPLDARTGCQDFHNVVRVIARLQVPNLGRPATDSPVNLTIDNEPAPHSRAHRDVEDRREPLPRSEERSASPATSASLPRDCRYAHEVAHPVGQRKTVPARDLVRFDDGASRIIHWPTKADANATERSTLDSGTGDELGYGHDDLLADAPASVGGVDRAAPQCHDRAVTVAQPELELRPTNLDSEEHRTSHSCWSRVVVCCRPLEAIDGLPGNRARPRLDRDVRGHGREPLPRHSLCLECLEGRTLFLPIRRSTALQ